MITTGSADSKTKKWMMDHIGWSLQLQRVECSRLTVLFSFLDSTYKLRKYIVETRDVVDLKSDLWVVMEPELIILGGITCWKIFNAKNNLFTPLDFPHK